MTPYFETRGQVNPERQRDRGWRTLAQIAGDLEPYFAALRELRHTEAAQYRGILSRTGDRLLRRVRVQTRGGCAPYPGGTVLAPDVARADAVGADGARLTPADPDRAA